MGHKELIRRNHTRAWRTTFKSMLKTVTLKRAGTGGDRNPVTGVITGGSPDIEAPINGMFREVDVKLQDGVNIVNTDSKFTVLQIDFKQVIEPVDPLDPAITNILTPLENDYLEDTAGNKWRVIQILNDPTDTFWHLIVRRL